MRYRAHVAFSTAYDILKGLEQVHNRRKAFIYVSNGYDFNPFCDDAGEERSRADGANQPGQRRRRHEHRHQQRQSPTRTRSSAQGNQFSAADLAAELSELTREANRANATIYTIDPRGLVGMPDLDEKIDMVEWQDYIPRRRTACA